MILIVNLGIPGSGKSSMSEYLKSQLSLLNISCEICSADNYHIINGKYQWEAKNAFIAHLKNISFCKNRLLDTDVCIFDNTNTNKNDFKEIVLYAKKYNSKILGVKFNHSNLRSHLNQQKHGVPIDKLENFANKIKNVDTTMFDYVYNIDCSNSFEENKSKYNIIVNDIKDLMEK